MVDFPQSTRDIFLMSPPGPHWRLRGRANFRSGSAQQVDANSAFQEWLALACAIENAGGHLLVLPADDEMTGLPYCAEAGHALLPRDGEQPRFLLPTMWAPHRKREVEHWKPFVEVLGFRAIPTGGGDGYWEGQGDVATFRGTEILFFGGRTDRAGLARVRSHFSLDALTIEVREPAFHGNVALLPLEACDRIVVCPALLTEESMAALVERFSAARILLISEEEACSYATNALPIGRTLIAPTVAPRRVLRALEDLGMEIVLLDMKELCEKAGGASRCLVCRVPADIAALLLQTGGTDLQALADARNTR